MNGSSVLGMPHISSISSFHIQDLRHFLVSIFSLFKVTFQRSATTIPETVGSPVNWYVAAFGGESRMFVVYRSDYYP